MRKKAQKVAAEREGGVLENSDQPLKEMKKKDSEKVSLQVWMRDRLARDKRLQPEHIAALQMHMKRQGLSAMESAEAYEKAYSTY